MPHIANMRNLKYILLSEWRQYEKTTKCMVPFISHSGKGKCRESKQISLPGNPGREDRRIE